MSNLSSHPLQESPDIIASRLIHKANNQDGLPEIAVGLIFLTAAGMQWLQVAFPPGSPPHKAAPLGLGLLVPALILGSQWAIKVVRRSFLVERAGYVEYKPANRKRLLTVSAIAFLVACAMAFAIAARFLPTPRWLLATTGLSGGILAVQAGRLPRFVIGGMLMAAVGVCLAILRFSLEMGFALLFTTMGLLALVSGCMVLLLFIRRPVQAGE